MQRPCIIAGIFTVALPLSYIRATDVTTADRPNILWLVSEDNGRFLGCYGDRLAHTPAIDKLAREGILYERCFTMPVCAPSRFTLISGMFPTTCGPAEHMRAQGKIPAWLRGFPAYLREAGYYTTNSAKTDYNAPIRIDDAWNESGPKAHWRNRKEGQPFFSVFNHEITHESCLFPEQEKPLDFPPNDPATMRIPPYQPDTPEIRADWARYYNHLRLLDEQLAAKLKDLADAGLADDTIVFYYSDNGGVLPRSKRFLQESGTHVPLVVYYPPKWRHLAPAASGSRISEPVHFVDFAPTVLSLAGIKIPDYMQGRAFAGAARAEPNEFVFCTRDRMDERYDMMRSVADARWLYIHNFRPDLPYVQPLEYMFKARGYQSWARAAAEGKLTPATAQFWGQKPTEELYDTEADPDNVRNLAGSAEHQATLERMRAALKQQVLKTKDNGFLPEGSKLEGYEASHSPDAWPVERVFDLAGLASQRNPANLPRFIEALNDESEPIRWWAAQGCTMLVEKAAPAEGVLRRRLDDDSGAVAIAAAEALARIGKLDAALPVLERWIQQEQPAAFVMQAANVMDRLGELARPSLEVMKRVSAAATANKGGTYPPQYILKHAVDVLEGRVEALVYPETTDVKQRSSLKAGAAKRKVTPPLWVPYLTSSGNGTGAPFTGVHDDLYARAVVSDDGRQAMALLAVDSIGYDNAILGLGRNFTAELRERIAARTDLKSDAIMLAASHTHSAPETLDLTEARESPRVAEWFERHLDDLVAIVVEAWQNRQPVNLRYGKTRVGDFARYRRIVLKSGKLSRNGPLPDAAEVAVPWQVDDELAVVYAETEAGKPHSVLLNFTAHPVIAMLLPEVSADYPGAATAAVEEALGGAICLFTQGTAGNINSPQVSGTFDDVAAAGKQLAQAAVNEIERLRREPPLTGCTVAVRSEVCRLKPRDCPSLEEALKQVQEHPTPLNQRMLRLASKLARDSLDAEVQAMRVGPIRWVSLPGEPFVETGFALKDRGATFVVGYANGYLGYFPIQRAYAEGGYETDPGVWSRVAPGSAEQLQSVAAKLLSQLEP